MRLYEFTESISQNTISSDLVDGMVTRFADMHSSIRKILKNAYDNNGGELSSRAIRLIVGGQKSRIKNNEYDSSLKPALYSLLDKTKDNDLKSFLSQSVNDQYNMSAIEKTLPQVLLKLSRKLNNKRLETAVQVWIKEINITKSFIESLESHDEDEDDNDISEPEVKSSIGSQYSAIDKIVNDALSRVDKKIAGDIRNAISKSDNKLLALQNEFRKRGINL